MPAVTGSDLLKFELKFEFKFAFLRRLAALEIVTVALVGERMFLDVSFSVEEYSLSKPL